MGPMKNDPYTKKQTHRSLNRSNQNLSTSSWHNQRSQCHRANVNHPRVSDNSWGFRFFWPRWNGEPKKTGVAIGRTLNKRMWWKFRGESWQSVNFNNFSKLNHVGNRITIEGPFGPNLNCPRPKQKKNKRSHWNKKEWQKNGQLNDFSSIISSLGSFCLVFFGHKGTFLEGSIGPLEGSQSWYLFV